MTKFKYNTGEKVLFFDAVCTIKDKYISEESSKPCYSIYLPDNSITIGDEANIAPLPSPDQKSIIRNRVEVSENQTVKHHLDISLVHLHKDEVCFVTKPITVNKHEAMKIIIDIKNHLDRIDAEEPTEE